MNRMLIGALSGLFCLVVAGGAVAATTAPAVSEPAPATPLSPDQYRPKLQEFYARGKALYDDSRSDKLSDQEVYSRFDAFLKWANEAGNWMNGAISPAATAQFTTWHAQFGAPRKLAGRHPDLANNRYSSLNIILPQLLENLRVMMVSDAADPQKAKDDVAK